MGEEGEREHKPQRIVVAGEFNAGKTSTINLLMRREVQVPSVQSSMMPPTVIFPAGKDSLRLVTTEGGYADAEAFCTGEIAGEDLSEVEIGTDFGDLDGATITEVSVDLNGTLNERSRRVLETADVLIWCTMGQRAWALTEISVVQELPATVRENAILVVTRADYLRDEDARALVQQRLDKEAGALFQKILQIAAGRKAVQQSADAQCWQEAGGRALHDAVMAALARARGEPPPPKVQEGEASATGTAPGAFRSLWTAEMTEFLSWLKGASDPISPEEVVHKLNALLDRIEEAHQRDYAGSVDAKNLAIRFGLARDRLQKTLEKTVSDEDAMRSLDLVLQLEEEAMVWSGSTDLGPLTGNDAMALYRAS